MLTKEDLRETDSNFYKDFTFKEEPTKHMITDEDQFDPGRVMFLYDLPFDYWPIIMKLNGIVDPINDLEPGLIILIPTNSELRKLKTG